MVATTSREYVFTKSWEPSFVRSIQHSMSYWNIMNNWITIIWATVHSNSRIFSHLYPEMEASQTFFWSEYRIPGIWATFGKWTTHIKPRTQLTFFFEGQPSKNKALFNIKQQGHLGSRVCIGGVSPLSTYDILQVYEPYCCNKLRYKL